jgi:hypothetical protein
VQERHRHQPLRHVAGALGRLAREPRILPDVLDHERLARHQHPAGDPRARGEAAAHELLCALAGDRLEDELVGLLVVQEDRRGPRGEDRARHLDDRP